MIAGDRDAMGLTASTVRVECDFSSSQVTLRDRNCRNLCGPKRKGTSSCMLMWSPLYVEARKPLAGSTLSSTSPNPDRLGSVCNVCAGAGGHRGQRYSESVVRMAQNPRSRASCWQRRTHPIRVPPRV